MTSDAPPNDKTALRLWAKNRRVALDMPRLSETLTERLYTLPEFNSARRIFLYLAMPDEVNVESLIEKSEKHWYAPRCAPRRRLAIHPYTPHNTLLRPGPFGIREPDPETTPEADPAILDLVIVPALAFSQQCDRLGYGGGYYDRFLPRLSASCTRVGLLPSALVLPLLPYDPWDAPLNLVITEDNIFRRGL